MHGHLQFHEQQASIDIHPNSVCFYAKMTLFLIFNFDFDQSDLVILIQNLLNRINQLSKLVTYVYIFTK